MPIPVVTSAQMSEWEQATWATGQTEAEVISCVGKKLARRARKLTRAGETILVLAGKGHNGDDARAAAKQIEGRNVDVLEMFLPDTDLLPLEFKLREKPALIIDGLFGVGLNRPLNEAWQKIIHAINAAGIPILAVDVPSGLNADTGENFGAVIQATHTLTVGAAKTGLLTPAGVAVAGRMEVAADVGLIPCPFKTELNVIQAEDFNHFPPTRLVESNKGTYGHLMVIAGSLGFHGAAVLATRSAQRAQPGLTTLFTQENVYIPVAAQLQAAMVGIWHPDFNPPENLDAILAGPGLASPDLPSELRMGIRRLWRVHKQPCVVDASALDMLAPEPFPKETIRVITPHPGEAARLLRTSVQAVLADRVGSLREISRRYGSCWVVLKGHQTLIGRHEGDLFVNLSGNPWLAQGGSGDVLSGFIAGLLAQPPLQADPGKTIRYAVWQHGAAADHLQATRSNWTVEDLINVIGNVR